MKKFITICTLILIMHCTTLPTTAKTLPSSTDRQIAELNKRFYALESNWGRFQIGGNLTIESGSYLTKPQSEIPGVDFKQQLSIFMDAQIDRNLTFSTKLSHYGGWGLNYESLGSNSYPMATPLTLDEAFLRMQYPTFLNYLGRFRFSPAPLGLISDFSANPVEGFAIQHSIKEYHLIGMYSRINTQYQTGSPLVSSSEDYFAARLGWSNKKSVIGINLVPQGITGEKNLSIDWTVNQSDSRFATELGWYSFDSQQYPDYKTSWTPGFLANFGKMLSANNFIQIKVGYFSPQFFPSFSSLAHTSGDNREWFLPNSQGIEFFYQINQIKTIVLDNRLLISSPVKNLGQPDLTYRLLSSLTKNFALNNQLQVGVEYKSNLTSGNTRLFGKWLLQF